MTTAAAVEREVLLELFAPGSPAPKGSTKGFVAQKRGRKARAVLTADNPLTQKSWTEACSAALDEAWRGLMPIPDPVHVHADFVMPRRQTAPRWWTPPHTRKPDGDKLTRCTWDCLTGIVIVDDAQVVSWSGGKREAEPGEHGGAYVRVERLIYPGPPERAAAA